MTQPLSFALHIQARDNVRDRWTGHVINTRTGEHKPMSSLNDLVYILETEAYPITPRDDSALTQLLTTAGRQARASEAGVEAAVQIAS